MDFTDDEIREELARLGYQNVPSDKLNEFKKDLLKLIQSETERTSKSNSLNSSVGESNVEEVPAFAEGNFTNHGSQWIQEDYKKDWHYKDDRDKSLLNFREDWEYRGEKSPREKFENTSNVVHERRVKSAAANKNRIPGSYANHELPIELERDNEDVHNKSNNMDMDCRSQDGGKVVKRKTCRTMANGGRRIDESFSESETEEIFKIYQKIKSMAVRDCECGKTKKTSSACDPPYRQKGGKKKIPSYIRKPLPPHTRNLKPSSPFVMMDNYNKMWNKQPAPGDADRSEVQKKIHQKMLHKDEIQIDNKVYVPNSFKIPSEKPRTALRWKVRSALEKYELPEHGFYHDI